jgi:carboxyl-terminal processing protease
MILTEREIRKLIAHYKDTLQPAYLTRGDLYPAFDIYNRYYDDAKARFAWIQKRLNQPFDFTRMEKYAPDRSKANWPTDTTDADKLWEQRLTYELLDELLNSATLEEPAPKLPNAMNARSAPWRNLRPKTSKPSF